MRSNALRISLERDRLRQRRLLAQPVPGDGAEQAVTERHEERHAIGTRLGE